MSAAKKPDWDRIQRDYSTGRYTVRELEAKHGPSYSQISRRAKKEEWTKDLRGVIREATSAAVIRESVAKAAATSAQQGATETVLVAAEIGKQVILAHRAELREARSLATDLLAELRDARLLAEHQELLAQILAGEGAEPVDEALARKAVSRALGTGSRISGVKALAESITKLHAAERIAFDLDDGAAAGGLPAEFGVAIRFVEPGAA